MIYMVTKYCKAALMGVACMLAGCHSEELGDISTEADANPIELTGIKVVIDNGGESSTRSSAGTMPSDLVDSIGRTAFGAHDQLVFTKICRTEHALNKYSYDGIRFNHSGGSWTYVDSSKEIYWSDGSSNHTFIGYCLPHATTGPAVDTGDDINFEWEQKEVGGKNYYYGSIGDPGQTDEKIDYSYIETIDGVQIPQNLRKEDLLLTFDTKIKNADGEPSANIVCHHALASVRVTVTITGFSTSSTDNDARAKVYDLLLKDQPVQYKWDQEHYYVIQLDATDNDNVVGGWNQKKEMKLWQPHPEGVGEGSGRSFTFYGINVPGTYDVPIFFTVRYPNPLDPNNSESDYVKTYKATLAQAQFRSGYCTAITINLNHKDEDITVGAQYITWEYSDAPDQGSLFKNSTFLEASGRDKISLMGDFAATQDDATWLYVESDGTIKDVYGHTGSESDPFQISTAYQLLSFAYEVKGNQGRLKNRTDNAPSISVKTAPGVSTTKTLYANDGFDFENYYIKLDAGLTLQSSADKVEGESGAPENPKQPVDWPGVGDENHAFNGTFQAGDRYISRLYGKSFFINIGEKGFVRRLILNDIIKVEDKGGLAEINSGVLSACKVDGNVLSSSTELVGSLVGTNKGLIFACYHIGDVSGAGSVGGLVGSNEGDKSAIVACYNMGQIIKGGSGTAYGVAAQAREGSIYGCFYDKTKAGELIISPNATDQASGYPSSGKTTSEIIKAAFVGTKNTADSDDNTPSLNGIIYKWTNALNSRDTYYSKKTQLSSHYFESQPASYPRVF